MKRPTIFICGGGTGGHLYPALAVGKKLREKVPELEIIFIGSQRAMEKEIIQHHGEKFIGLKIAGLRGKGARAILSIPLVPIALIKSIYLIIKKRPRLVIGMGGYSSGPMTLAAWLLGRPRLILEQNARPGFTNRLLRPFVPKAVVAFQGTLSYFGHKGICLGNPVREEFNLIPPRQPHEFFTLLIFGGSQGSRFLNQLMVEALACLIRVKEKLRIFHQTGPKDLSWVERAYREQGFNRITIAPYFFDMASRFAAADLIICRAGATSVAEIIAAQRPAVLIPFAQAAENHQYWNAYELAASGAADLLPESEATPQVLADKILSYLEEPHKLKLMEERLSSFKLEKPEEKIASLCLELMKFEPRMVSLG